MPELIVTARELRYGGKSLVRGARFTASEKDAKVLKLVRKAEDAPPAAPLRKVATTAPPPPPSAPVEPEEAAPPVTPAEDAPAPVEEEAARPYRTRRLKAED